MKTEVRSCMFVEPQGREDASLRSILRLSPEGRDPAEDRLSVAAHAIGPINDRVGIPATRDGHCVTTSSHDHVTPLRPWRRSGR